MSKKFEGRPTQAANCWKVHFPVARDATVRWMGMAILGSVVVYTVYRAVSRLRAPPPLNWRDPAGGWEQAVRAGRLAQLREGKKADVARVLEEDLDRLEDVRKAITAGAPNPAAAKAAEARCLAYKVYLKETARQAMDDAKDFDPDRPRPGPVPPRGGLPLLGGGGGAPQPGARAPFQYLPDMEVYFVRDVLFVPALHIQAAFNPLQMDEVDMELKTQWDGFVGSHQACTVFSRFLKLEYIKTWGARGTRLLEDVVSKRRGWRRFFNHAVLQNANVILRLGSLGTSSTLRFIHHCLDDHLTADVRSFLDGGVYSAMWYFADLLHSRCGSSPKLGEFLVRELTRVFFPYCDASAYHVEHLVAVYLRAVGQRAF